MLDYSMRCPDCGTRLSEIRVQNKLAYRCFKCGGFWADSDAVNNLNSGELATWRRISVDPRYFADGSGLCPLDGMKMEKYTGESVPVTMNVKRCVRCGKWWFSGDSLHEYKPAQEAKFNYYRLWGITRNVTEVFLPLMVVFITGVGLGVGLTLLKSRQQVAVPASAGVREFTAIYVGGGEATVSFKSRAPVSEIEYREAGGAVWLVEPVELVGGMYRVGLADLVEGREYEVRVLGTVYRFAAR